MHAKRKLKALEPTRLYPWHAADSDAGYSATVPRIRNGALEHAKEKRTSYRSNGLICHKYRLMRRLGSGGMGSVWLAHHVDLDMQVALKLIRADLEDDRLGPRFLGEARVLARVEHRAVVRILDFGRTEFGDPFIVMELLRGEDMRSALERVGTLPAERAVSLLLPIAEGLSVAHCRQVVHRDVKPDNIFIAHAALGVQPKILDFGIARCLAPQFDAKVTGSGQVVGSPEYMSPEQAEGREDIDHRADIWGFCGVLYEAVSGQRPFTYDGCYERLLRRIVEEPVRPLSEFGIDEPDLWRILSRGFEKDPNDRWQRIEELGAELANWLSRRGRREDVCGTSLTATWLHGPAAASLRTASSSDPRPSGLRGTVRQLWDGARYIKWSSRGMAAAALLSVSLLGAFVGRSRATSEPETIRPPTGNGTDSAAAAALAASPAASLASLITSNEPGPLADQALDAEPSVELADPEATAESKHRPARRRPAIRAGSGAIAPAEDADGGASLRGNVAARGASSNEPARWAERSSVDLFYNDLGF